MFQSWMDWAERTVADWESEEKDQEINACLLNMHTSPLDKFVPNFMLTTVKLHFVEPQKQIYVLT